MNWWFNKPYFIGAYLGALASSFFGLNWIYTLLIWPLIFFGLDVIYDKFRVKNG